MGFAGNLLVIFGICAGIGVAIGLGARLLVFLFAKKKPDDASQKRRR
jgi:hypothetical protein